MNQRKLLLGSIPLILLAVGAVLWTRRDPLQPEESVAEAAAATPDTAVAAPGELSAAAPDVTASEKRSDVAETDARAEREASLLADAHLVPVSLLLPAGVPTDELIELVATSFPLSAYGDESAARRAASNWNPSAVDMGQMFRAFSGDRTPAPKDERALSLPCEPDGRGGYVARFAKDSVGGVLELRARYFWRDNVITSVEVHQALDVTVPEGWQP